MAVGGTTDLFWYVTPFGLVGRYCSFGGTCYLSSNSNVEAEDHGIVMRLELPDIV